MKPKVLSQKDHLISKNIFFANNNVFKFINIGIIFDISVKKKLNKTTQTRFSKIFQLIVYWMYSKTMAFVKVFNEK